MLEAESASALRNHRQVVLDFGLADRFLVICATEEPRVRRRDSAESRSRELLRKDECCGFRALLRPRARGDISLSVYSSTRSNRISFRTESFADADSRQL